MAGVLKPISWWFDVVVLPILGVLGILALIGASNDWKFLSDFLWATWWGFKTPYWTAVAIAIAISALGLVWAPIKATLARARSEAEMMTAFKETLIPAARKLLANANHAGQSTQSIAESIMSDVRAYVAPDGTTADANFYVLRPNQRGNTTLQRTHKSYKNARPQFELKRASDLSRDELEEAAVVERIVQREQARCANVSSGRLQKKFNLNAERQRDYKAFMSIPVQSTDGGTVRAIGMLSVNSNDKKVLQKFHFDYLYMVAALLSEFHQIRPFQVYSSDNVSTKKKKGRGGRR